MRPLLLLALVAVVFSEEQYPAGCPYPMSSSFRGCEKLCVTSSDEHDVSILSVTPSGQDCSEAIYDEEASVEVVTGQRQNGCLEPDHGDRYIYKCSSLNDTSCPAHNRFTTGLRFGCSKRKDGKLYWNSLSE